MSVKTITLGFFALYLLIICAVTFSIINSTKRPKAKPRKIKQLVATGFLCRQHSYKQTYAKLANSVTLLKQSRISGEANFSESDGKKLKYCNPPWLTAKKQSKINTNWLNLPHVFSSSVRAGGWKPTGCISRESVAVLVPYRNRMQHLQELLLRLHHIMQEQLIDYRIFVIEQSHHTVYNKGILMNTGFTEVSKRFPHINCFIFHDVDLLPESHRLLYSCDGSPKQLSTRIRYTDEAGNISGYFNFFYFGGVTAITRKQFLAANGFSILYFGWGGEDEDMMRRLRKVGFKINFTNTRLGRYTMIHHKRDAGNEVNSNKELLLANSTVRWQIDGMNSLKLPEQSVNYTELHLFNLISVEIYSDFALSLLIQWGFKCL